MNQLGTKSAPGAFDPLENAPDDEPVFALMGRDPCASGTITFWAEERRRRAFQRYGIEPENERDKALLKAELLQCAEAEDAAMRFVEWRKNEAAPEGNGRATYADVAKTKEQLDAADRLKRLEGLMRNIQEARYHLCEMKDGLRAMGLISPLGAAEIELWLERAQQIADEHQPKRARFASEPTLPLAQEQNNG